MLNKVDYAVIGTVKQYTKDWNDNSQRIHYIYIIVYNYLHI